MMSRGSWRWSLLFDSILGRETLLLFFDEFQSFIGVVDPFVPLPLLLDYA